MIHPSNLKLNVGVCLLMTFIIVQAKCQDLQQFFVSLKKEKRKIHDLKLFDSNSNLVNQVKINSLWLVKNYKIFIIISYFSIICPLVFCATAKSISRSFVRRVPLVLQGLKQDFKNDLIAGLLVVIPLATTIWLTITIANWVIEFLTRIPKQLNPFDGFNPFLTNILNFLVGLAVPLMFILLIGLMARNIVGRWLLDFGEKFLQAIPLAGSVYKTLKQILETLLKDSNSKFRKVVMVEYPRHGIWTIGFVTGTLSNNLQSHLSKPMLSIFIPTTPNPTSGWYAMVPQDEVINLSISIEDAFKILISGGIVSPDRQSSVPISLDLPYQKVRLKEPLSSLSEEQPQVLPLEQEGHWH